MSYERTKQGGAAAPSTGTEQEGLAPGKRTLTAPLRGPVQAKRMGSPPADVHERAAHGTAGTPGALPYLDRIQRAFGRHDISSLRAHTGDGAAEATRAMGARAFATGHHVVLGPDSDLHTVAHEAAHVVQQRSGVQLAGGVGQAGDAHEKHADQVADLVVAGQSVEALLDHYGDGGNAAAAPAVQHQLQFQLRTGSTATQSAGIVREVAAGDNVSAMNALLRALRQTATHRRESGSDEHVVCVGGADSYDLTIASSQAPELQRLLEHRIGLLQQAATDSALAPMERASGADRDAVSRDEFSVSFNTYFAQLLAPLRASGRAASDDPTRPDFTADELRILLTPNQRAKLRDFFENQVVPDQLFGGDELGAFNAPQRIVLSSRILAVGTYQTGSISQRMHARMCGHWVELVNTYAGVVRDRGTGVELQFDHEGNLALGGGHMHSEYTGDRGALGSQSLTTGHREFQQVGMPPEQFESRIRPGDWLYVFTNTDTRGGNHSIVFVQWLGGVVSAEGGLQYRPAMIFSQGDPDRGGTQSTYLLGNRYVVTPHGKVYPVTRVARFESNARPPETVDDIREHELGLHPDRDPPAAHAGSIPELAAGPAETVAANFQLVHQVEGRHHGRLDLEQLRRAIRARNATLLGQLVRHATEGQLLLLRETNEREDFETLIRLNERLNHLAHNATGLETTEAAQAARMDEPHRAQEAELLRQTTELDRQFDAIGRELEESREVWGYDVQLHSLEGQHTAVSARIRSAHSLPAARRAEPLKKLEPRRARIVRETARITALRTQSLADEAREHTAQGTEATRIGSRINAHQRVNRLIAHQAALHHQIDKLEAAAGYHTAHPGSGAVFRGITRDENGEAHGEAPLTGRLAAVTPALDWSGLITPGQPGLADEARERGATAVREARESRQPAPRH